MKVEFKYNLGDPVTVIDVDRPGRVDSQSNDINGQQYRVVYWCDSQRRCAWMYDWELEPRKEQNK